MELTNVKINDGQYFNLNFSIFGIVKEGTGLLKVKYGHKENKIEVYQLKPNCTFLIPPQIPFEIKGELTITIVSSPQSVSKKAEMNEGGESLSKQLLFGDYPKIMELCEKYPKIKKCCDQKWFWYDKLKLDYGVNLSFNPRINWKQFYQSKWLLKPDIKDLYSLNDNCRFDLIGKFDFKNSCNISELLINPELMAVGASESILITGKIKNSDKEIVIKLTFKSKTNNSFEIEREVYKITNQLVTNYHTPHLILNYGIVKCNDYQLIEKVDKKVKKLSENCDLNSAWLLILEKMKGLTLYSFIKDYKPDYDVISQIMFQIIWTLLNFERINLMHNDLHTYNIFISVQDEPKTFVYSFNSEHVFALKTKYVVKIFDYDRSYCGSSKLNKNPLINTFLYGEECTGYGQCNKFTPAFDFLTIAWNLYAITKNSGKLWLETLIPHEWLTKENAWNGHPCKCVKGVPLKCKKCIIFEPENKNLLSDLLTTKFKEFELSQSDSDPLVTNNNFIYKLFL